MHNCYPSARGTQGADMSSRSSVTSTQSNNNNNDMALIRCTAKYYDIEYRKYHTGMTSPDTPPPSPPNEHQTEAKIEYTDASTIKVSKDRPPKRRPASSDLDSNTDPLSVPSVEVREPTADVITKPPCKQHLSHDEIELETIVSAFDDVLDGQVHDPEQRSTAGSDAHSAGTVSAKSTHRLIGKKFEEDEPDGMWCNFMIGCCTCLGFFCFT